MVTHGSILAEESHGQRRLAGYSPWGRKESDTSEATEHTHTHLGGSLSSFSHLLFHLKKTHLPRSYFKYKIKLKSKFLFLS